MPEVQPRDTNDRVVLFPLSMLGRKHILMARSVAEGPNTLIYCIDIDCRCINMLFYARKFRGRIAGNGCSVSYL